VSLAQVTLVLGIGGASDATGAALIALVHATLAEHGIERRRIACVATIDRKADAPAVRELADALGVPARFFSAQRLNEETPRLLNPSDAVLRAIGCPGVAEGAALAAAGPDAVLIVPKTRGTGVTCAIAHAKP
jgi:cobalt-precorrin 5A hydrolase/precorrin-3B C17-methyltransferase